MKRARVSHAQNTHTQSLEWTLVNFPKFHPFSIEFPFLNQSEAAEKLAFSTTDGKKSENLRLFTSNLHKIFTHELVTGPLYTKYIYTQMFVCLFAACLHVCVRVVRFGK